MKRPPVVTKAAKADIECIYGSLEAFRVGLGEKFKTKLQVVLERVATNPELHGAIWQSVRAARIEKSSYVVYYILRDHRTDVIAVAHGARGDFAWRSRL